MDLDLIVSLFALFVSAIALFVSAVFFYLSDQRASEANRLASEANTTSRSANEISTEALVITRLDHKSTALPKITARYDPILDYESNSFFSVLFIYNESLGRAKITKITSNPNFKFASDFDGGDLSTPIELGYNNCKRIKVYFEDVPLQNLDEVEDFKKIRVMDRNEKRFNKFIHQHIFTFYFQDSLKNHYATTLFYNKEAEKFLGEPVEVV